MNDKLPFPQRLTPHPLLHDHPRSQANDWKRGGHKKACREKRMGSNVVTGTGSSSSDADAGAAGLPDDDEEFMCLTQRMGLTLIAPNSQTTVTRVDRPPKQGVRVSLAEAECSLSASDGVGGFGMVVGLCDHMGRKSFVILRLTLGQGVDTSLLIESSSMKPQVHTPACKLSSLTSTMYRDSSTCSISGMAVLTPIEPMLALAILNRAELERRTKSKDKPVTEHLRAGLANIVPFSQQGLGSEPELQRFLGAPATDPQGPSIHFEFVEGVAVFVPTIPTTRHSV